MRFPDCYKLLDIVGPNISQFHKKKRQCEIDGISDGGWCFFISIPINIIVKNSGAALWKLGIELKLPEAEKKENSHGRWIYRKDS